MPITVDRIDSKTLELKLMGTLEKKDYALFTPYAEACIDEQGEINFIVHVPEKPSITPGALWEDLKFDVKHFNDVGRLALVSTDESKEWLATVSKPFTSAEVRFFGIEDIDAARSWAAGADTS